MPAPVIPHAEDTVMEILRRYEDKGATNQFSSRPGAVIHCHGCGADEPAEQTPLVALHRFEGISNPDDMSALAALECAECGWWGTMAFTYGTYASADDAAVFTALLDDRDQSSVEPGQ